MSVLGRKTRIKHINTRNKEPENKDIEIKLNKEDIKYLLPVLKEVIKTVHPPSSLLVEIFYFIYQHAEELAQIIELMKEGNYDEALKIAIQIVGEELAVQLLGYIRDYFMEDLIDEMVESVITPIKDEKTKEISKKVTQGTITGVTESLNEQIVDKLLEQTKDKDEENENENK